MCSACAGESTEGLSMTSRRFPAPWQVEQIPGGYKVAPLPPEKTRDVKPILGFTSANSLGTFVQMSF